METKELMYILFGWLLGIIGPRIADYINNHYKRRGLKKSINLELQDVKNRIVWIPHIVLKQYGKLDLKTLHWLKSEDAFEDKDDEIKNYFKKGDEELQKYLDGANAISKKENPSFNFKKIETFFIDSNLANFYLLDDKTQINLLDCKFHFKSLNEEINLVNDFLKMTFDSGISSENHQIIKDNIDKTNLLIVQKSIWCVETINKLVKQLG